MPDPSQAELVERITTANTGPTGPAGADGATGATGAAGSTGATGSAGATGSIGPSGVIAVTAPITNAGTSTSANIGIVAATTGVPGSMSAADKTKLDAIIGSNTGDQSLAAYAPLAGANVFSNTTNTFQHLKGGTSAPAIAAGAALVTPTLLSIAGTDIAGQINITPASTGGTSGVTATVTFNVAYAVTPTVILVAKNTAAIVVQGTTKALQVTGESTTKFDISPGAVGLVSGNPLQYNYLVIQ